MNKRDFPPIILASASPRRRQILKQFGYKFQVRPSRIKEEGYHGLSPSELVKKLACDKAVAVARETKGNALVVGADTIVVKDGEILGKPRDAQHAAEMLQKLSGSIHAVYTGVAVINTSHWKIAVGYEKTEVKMKRLLHEEIKVFSRRHLDKAGAYAVQEEKDIFVEKIKGCYYNVVGLPVRLLKKLISQALKKRFLRCSASQCLLHLFHVIFNFSFIL